MTDDDVRIGLTSAEDDEHIQRLLDAAANFAASAAARVPNFTADGLAAFVAAGGRLYVAVELMPQLGAALIIERPGQEPEVLQRWERSAAPSDMH